MLPTCTSLDIFANLPFVQLGLLDKWSETKTVPHLRPFCKSITSVRDPLKPVKAIGWEAVSHNDKKSYEAVEVGSEVVSRSSVLHAVSASH